MRIRVLNMKNVIANIRGLSLGDKAYCGPYGTITCTHSANARHSNFNNVSDNRRGMHFGYTRNSRRFSVSGSTMIHNGGGWSMKGLREAIGA